MSISAKDLVGTYILVKTNGEHVHEHSESGVRMKLTESDDKLKVEIKVANRMWGTLRYADGKLTGGLMSTRMAGTKFQMMVENALSSGFMKGMHVSFKDADLVLSHEDTALHFIPEPELAVCE